MSKNSKQLKTPIWLWIISASWGLWVIADFFQKHPLYFKSLMDLDWIVPIVQCIIAASFGFFFWTRYKKNNFHIKLHHIALFFMLTVWLSAWTLVLTNQIQVSGKGALFYHLNSLLYVFLACMICWSGYNLGRFLINSLASIRDEEWSYTELMAIGLSIITLVSFILGSLGLFNIPLVALVLIIPFILNYKSILSLFTNGIKLNVFAKDKLNVLGLLSLMFIVLFNAVTYSDTMTAMPRGFDAMNYYINLPNLMADSGALLEGYQPYNWSIIQTLGKVITGKVEMLLVLSWIGLPLLQLAIFEFSKQILKIETNKILMAIVLLTSMPLVLTQASAELKIDLAYTFVCIAGIFLMFRLITSLNENQEKLSKKSLGIAILLGLIIGFALGIKLTAIILLLCLTIVLWYSQLGLIAGLAVFLISFALIFFVGLDSTSGMNQFHTSTAWFKYLLMCSGIGLFIYSFKNSIKQSLSVLKITVVIGIVCICFFSPWMVKNYSESKNPTLMQLLNGKAPGDQLNLRLLNKNLEK